MINDLINKKALIEAFKEEFFGMYSDDFNYMIKWFEGLPSFEPDADMCWGCNCPKMKDAERGRWITRGYMCECTACGHSRPTSVYPMFYCPNCGARMEGENG